MEAIQQIDWAAPWLEPWRTVGERVAQRVRDAQAGHAACVADALNRCADDMGDRIPVRFTAQSDLTRGTAYEAFIRSKRLVPTRDNLHDFFNGLAWLHMPLTKSTLNRLQAHEIEQMGIHATRGPVRDAMTVFDENGGLLCAPAPQWADLQARDWNALFVTHRERWAQARLVLFGHALLEKLVTPRKPMVAHVLAIPLPMRAASSWDELDAATSGALSAELLSRKPFLPMPVLGVPGWWAANAQAEFYRDDRVFRPLKP